MSKVYVSRKILRYLPEKRKIIKQLAILCRAREASRLTVYAVFIVMAVAGMLSPVSSFAQQWVLFCKGQNATWYYDSNSVKFVPGGKVQVLTKSVSASKDADAVAEIAVRVCQSSNKLYKNVAGEFSYEVDQYEINFNTGEVRNISLTYYDKNGKILCKDTTTGTEWSKIDPQSCTSLLYQELFVLWLGGKK
jgi:hypothetical protein